MTKVKITGRRSIQSKLQRLAWELSNDASRINGEHGESRQRLVNGLFDISRKLGDMSRGLDDGGSK